MASYNELNALIDAYINRNGVQAITGQILNGVLKAMVEQLGRGYTIMGAAIPTTDPGTPDGPECYFASETGTYTDFDGLQVALGELALLCYTPSDGWTKATIYEGFQEVGATIDGNVGTPSVGVSYAGGVLSFDFHNMKGATGDPAGFGTVNATVDGNIGTPGVSIQTSGPDTAKNITFAFTNLKGETGVTSVVATVDNTSGNPQCAVSLVGQQLTLAFSGLKGAQGNTGSSVDYPFTIVNNLTTDDATQALSAAQGVVLDGKVTQLEAELTESVEYSDATLEPFATGKYIYWQYGYQWPKATATIGGLIPLKAGQTIKVNIPQIVDANTIAIAVLKPNGVDFYPSDQAGVRSVTGQSDYEYTAMSDCQVAVCYTTAGGYSAVVPGDFITKKVADLTDEVHEISESIGDIGGTAESAKDALDGYSTITPEVAETDKGLHFSYKKIVSAAGFLYTKPIWLNKGDTIKMVLSGGTPNGLYSAIARLIYDGMNYSLLVGQVANVYEYQWTALYDTYVALCYPSASVATVTVKRVAVPAHISRVDPAEPMIVAPFHEEPADGTDGSIFNAETVTADELDAEAQNIVRNYPGVFNREVMGRDASGTYDIARYIFTKRDFFAYKASDGLFAWKSGDTLVYTSSVCPVAGDTVYDSSRAEIGVVGSYNSTDSEMTVSGVAYIRSWEDNIQPDVIFLNYDLAESVRAFTYLIHPVQAYRYVVNAKKQNLGEWTADNYNISTGVFTWDGKSYVRDKSLDFGDTQEHTLVLWGNEHAPQRDPAEPAITLLKMMQDLASSCADDNPLLRYIKYHCKVVFIPCANPWGMTRHTTTPSYSGETNYNGVNINRNYDFQWESVTGLKGAAAGDQPETRYLMDTCGIFGADLAMDIHCLGYGGYINRVCYDAVLPEGDINNARQEMQRGYNKYLSLINGENAQSPGEGSGFICHTLGIGGGLIEMNAGIPNETLHCAGIMQMDYDFLLKMIRLFLRITAPNLYITR